MVPSTDHLYHLVDFRYFSFTRPVHSKVICPFGTLARYPTWIPCFTERPPSAAIWGRGPSKMLWICRVCSNRHHPLMLIYTSGEIVSHWLVLVPVLSRWKICSATRGVMLMNLLLTLNKDHGVPRYQVPFCSICSDRNAHCSMVDLSCCEAIGKV